MTTQNISLYIGENRSVGDCRNRIVANYLYSPVALITPPVNARLFVKAKSKEPTAANTHM